MKRILLIGVSSGLGLDVVSSLAEQGNTTIFAAAPDTEPMECLREYGVQLLEMDVTCSNSIENAVQRMVASCGAIDCVLFNAGLHQGGAIEAVSDEQVERLFQVNVFGAAKVIKAVSKQFRSQGFGRILFTSSVVAHVSTLMAGWYSASKHALDAMVSAYRQEVAQFNIEVVLIEPGQINTGFETRSLEHLDRLEHPQDYRNMVSQYRNMTVHMLQSAPGTRSTVNQIIQAIHAKKPKLVYRTTKDAVWLPRVKRLLGTRLMDRYVVGAYRKMQDP